MLFYFDLNLNFILIRVINYDIIKKVVIIGKIRVVLKLWEESVVFYCLVL